MSLKIEKSPSFQADVVYQYGWYANEAGEELARQFAKTVNATVLKLSVLPDLGRVRRFSNPALKGLRSFRVEAPFDKHLIFYRADEKIFQAWRLMHGARDLQRRLAEPGS